MQCDLGMKKAIANSRIEPMSIQSQKFHALAPSTIRPEQHICIHNKNQLFCLKPCKYTALMKSFQNGISAWIAESRIG